METRTLAGRASGSERQPWLVTTPETPRLGWRALVYFLRPSPSPSQGPQATLTPRRRRIHCCCPRSVPRRRWRGRGSGTGAAQRTGGTWCRGLQPILVDPVPGLTWPQDPRSRAPHAARSAASGVTGPWVLLAYPGRILLLYEDFCFLHIK